MSVIAIRRKTPKYVDECIQRQRDLRQAAYKVRPVITDTVSATPALGMRTASLAARLPFRITRSYIHDQLSACPAPLSPWLAFRSQPATCPHTNVRHFTWLPWRRGRKQHKPVSPPSYPRQPHLHSVLGKEWVDQYHWVQQHEAVAPYLEQEAMYYHKHAQQWAALRRQLEKEMWAHVREQVRVHS